MAVSATCQSNPPRASTRKTAFRRAHSSGIRPWVRLWERPGDRPPVTVIRTESEGAAKAEDRLHPATALLSARQVVYRIGPVRAQGVIPGDTPQDIPGTLTRGVTGTGSFHTTKDQVRSISLLIPDVTTSARHHKTVAEA